MVYIQFLRDVISRFLWSTGHPWNFNPRNFIGKTLAYINQRAGYLWTAMLLRLTLVRTDSKFWVFQPYHLQLLIVEVVLNLVHINLLHFSICSVCMAPTSMTGHVRLSPNMDYDIHCPWFKISALLVEMREEVCIEMNTKSANFLRLVILENKIRICDILEIYMPQNLYVYSDVWV